MLEIGLTGCKILDRVLDKKPLTILVYGPAGSGKTSLLLHVSKRLSLSGERVLFISTEGRLYQARIALQPRSYVNALFTEVDSFNKQLELVLTTIPFIEYKYIVFDTINSLYRLEAYREGAIEKLGLLLGILRRVVEKNNGVLLASAQVRAVEDDREFIASGMTILEYWFDIIACLSRDNGKRVLTIVKPSDYKNISVEFTITDKGIIWIGC